MARDPKKERFRYYNHLVCLVKGLEGHYTTIDLQNEACLTGRIKSVDGYMNIELEDAVFYDPRGIQHPFEIFFVRGRLIRYVHIPKDQLAAEVITKQLNSMVAVKSAQPETFKVRRAKMYQKETIKNLHAV